MTMFLLGLVLVNWQCAHMLMALILQLLTIQTLCAPLLNYI